MCVYILTRVSTSDQAEGTSLAEQERKCQGAAMMAGLDVDRVFMDACISGSVPLAERPQGGEMLALLQPGDTVIVAKIDRLFRSAADALTTVQDWHKRNINLIVAEFGAEPVTENGTSKLLFGILSMTAEFERDLIRQRVSEGRASKKANGGHIGGSVPFGYRKVGEGRGAMLEPIPEQQQAIDRMVTLRAEGYSLRATAEQIKAEYPQFKVSHVAVKNALARRGL